MASSGVGYFSSFGSFVGQNANGILEWWTAAILAELERAGFRTHLLDLKRPSVSGESPRAAAQNSAVEIPY